MIGHTSAHFSSLVGHTKLFTGVLTRPKKDQCTIQLGCLTTFTIVCTMLGMFSTGPCERLNIQLGTLLLILTLHVPPPSPLRRIGDCCNAHCCGSCATTCDEAAFLIATGLSEEDIAYLSDEVCVICCINDSFLEQITAVITL